MLTLERMYRFTLLSWLRKPICLQHCTHVDRSPGCNRRNTPFSCVFFSVLSGNYQKTFMTKYSSQNRKRWQVHLHRICTPSTTSSQITKKTCYQFKYHQILHFLVLPLQRRSQGTPDPGLLLKLHDSITYALHSLRIYIICIRAERPYCIAQGTLIAVQHG